MEDDAQQHATTHGSGQSVIVNLGGGFKFVALAISGLIVALILSCTVSLLAYAKATNAETQAAMWSFWGQRLESNLIAHGFAAPPSPKADNQ